MKIEIDWEIGDKVYIIKYVDTHYFKCDSCYGSGSHDREDYCGYYSVACSKCDGRGTWEESTEPYWKVDGSQYEIGGIQASCPKNIKLRIGYYYEFSNHKQWFDYDIGLRDRIFPNGLISQEYCFKTKKQAEAAAKRATKAIRDAEKVLRSKGR